MLALCCIFLCRKQELYQYRAWAVVSYQNSRRLAMPKSKNMSNSATSFFILLIHCNVNSLSLCYLSKERRHTDANERLKILFLSQEIANFNQ